MADHMREALAKMLDEYDARRRGDIEREQKTKDDAALFLQRFAELRSTLIRPVFEIAGEMLEARGHRFSIVEQESVGGPGGKTSEAGISLRIIPAGTRAPVHDDQRSLSVTTRHYNKTVWINSGEAPNAGGIAGAKGAYALEKVTRQLVEEEVIGFVAKVVAA
jgi:hypothetical protein